MKSSQETMLAANALIHEHGTAAEEYAALQLWDSRQKADKGAEAQWLGMLEAIKQVRSLREQTKRGP